MSDTGYIYPRWMEAKMKLEANLLRAETKSEIRDVLNRWFQETIFEIGFTQKAHKYDLDKMSKEQRNEYQRHQTRAAAVMLAEQIINNDLYRSEIRDDGDYTANLTVTVAVVGLPRFVQDKNKVLKYVRD